MTIHNVYPYHCILNLTSYSYGVSTFTSCRLTSFEYFLIYPFFMSYYMCKDIELKYSCRILSSQSSGYKEVCLLGYNAVSSVENQPIFQRNMFSACFMWVSCSDFSSTLKLEVTCSSRTSVDFQQTTPHCIPEDRTLLKIFV
jgi:hypothetical protein